MLHRIFGVLLSCILSAGLAGCSTTQGPKADLKKIYDKTAQYHAPDRNPVIVIPGILGSRLVDDASGQTVWGAFRSEYADPGTAEGAQLISLSLDGKHPLEFGDVRPDGVLENLELKLAGFPISIQAYSGILTTLGVGGYRDETLGLNSVNYGTDHFTCFQFDYDWRRDIAYNAGELKRFIDEKRVEIQAQYKEDYGLENADVKFDIVAHSMGGVLTRYFLRYGDTPLPKDGSAPELSWSGAADVERAILVAPPNAGSLEAFEQLIEGFNTGRPLLPYYSPAILGTFPSIYQLLPRARHKSIVWDEDISTPIEDIFDPEVWQTNGWGLSSDDDTTTKIIAQLLPNTSSAIERKALAVQFQSHALERAQQFQTALDIPSSPPVGLDLYLVTGDAIDTPSIMGVDRETGDIKVLRENVGDKTVLRSSTLMDERVGATWTPTVQSPIDYTSVLFLPSEHRKITSDPIFEDNVLYWLLEDPRRHEHGNTP